MPLYRINFNKTAFFKNVRFIFLWGSIIYILFIGITTCTYGETASSFGNYSTGRINVFVPSKEEATAEIVINIGKNIVERGEIVRPEIKILGPSSSFTAISTSHHQRGRYIFDGLNSENLIIKNLDTLETFTAKEKVIFDKSGKYGIFANVKLRWKVERGKLNIGFPRFFWRTFISQGIIIKIWDPQQEEEPKYDGESTIEPLNPLEIQAEEKKIPKLNCKILHTEKWNKNRKAYNNRVLREKNLEELRQDHVFWPGEKFLLEACPVNLTNTEWIRVEIEGTEYKAELTPFENKWIGSIFNKDMKDKWKNADNIILTFKFQGKEGLFEEEVDITVDNREEFWLLHRKE